MHEMPITESILKIVLEHAEKENASEVKQIHIVIGDLASIVDDSIAFYWDIISKGTIAEQAQLFFRRIPAEMKCIDCGHTYSPAKHELLCPECGSAKVQVTKGTEFFLEAIDVELNEPDQEDQQ